MFLGKSNSTEPPSLRWLEELGPASQIVHLKKDFTDPPTWIVRTIAPIIIIAVVASLILSYFGSKYDPKEPPVLPQKIPLFGHILGILQHGLKYYTIIR